jgi:hypothetical protein
MFMRCFLLGLKLKLQYCFEFLMDCFHQWRGIDTTNMVVESMKKKKSEENGLFSLCHRDTLIEDQINWPKQPPGF